MKLSDQTIINEPIKFLSTVYPLGREGFSFTFNVHKVRCDTKEQADALRKEILENVPEAEMPKPKEGLDKTMERFGKMEGQ